MSHDRNIYNSKVSLVKFVVAEQDEDQKFKNQEKVYNVLKKTEKGGRLVPQRMIFLIKKVPSSRKANKKLEKRGAATFSFIFLLEADLFFPLLVLLVGLTMKMKADYWNMYFFHTSLYYPLSIPIHK